MQTLPRRGTDTVASVLRAHAAHTPAAPFLLFEQAPGRTLEISYS